MNAKRRCDVCERTDHEYAVIRVYAGQHDGDEYVLCHPCFAVGWRETLKQRNRGRWGKPRLEAMGEAPIA